MGIRSNDRKRARTRLGMWHLVTLLIGLMVATASGPTRAETVTYYHNDALGSPVAATDANGNLLWREVYTPYGERIGRDAAAADNNRWYTGHQETGYGLVYMGARHYDPEIGRFLSVDPVRFQEGHAHSFNRYAYAANNPYRYVDPDGRWIEDAVLGIPSLALGAANFYSNVRDGNYGSAALDAGGMVLDIGAIAAPGVPGGVGIAITTGRLGKAAAGAPEGMTTVRHYTDAAGKEAISDAGSLRPGTFVTLPGEIPSRSGHLQIEKALEIQPGRGSNYIDVEVPSSRLRVPSNGRTTSGGAWQRQLSDEVPIDSSGWRRPPGRPAGS
jgi:RHS repeat-associated protein